MYVRGVYDDRLPKMAVLVLLTEVLPDGKIFRRLLRCTLRTG